MTTQGLTDRITGLARKVASTASSATTLERTANIADNTRTIPGLTHTRVASTEPLIVEAKDLERLGTAGGRSFFVYRDGEVRADVEVPVDATNDSLPAHRLILHSTERVAKRIVEDPGDGEWAKSVRRTIEAHTRDHYWRCTVLPAGSYEAARRRDEAHPPRQRTTELREPIHPVKVGAANATAVEFWDDLRAGRTPRGRVER